MKACTSAKAKQRFADKTYSGYGHELDVSRIHERSSTQQRQIPTKSRGQDIEEDLSLTGAGRNNSRQTNNKRRKKKKKKNQTTGSASESNSKEFIPILETGEVLVDDSDSDDAIKKEYQGLPEQVKEEVIDIGSASDDSWELQSSTVYGNREQKAVGDSIKETSVQDKKKVDSGTKRYIALLEEKVAQSKHIIVQLNSAFDEYEKAANKKFEELKEQGQAKDNYDTKMIQTLETDLAKEKKRLAQYQKYSEELKQKMDAEKKGKKGKTGETQNSSHSQHDMDERNSPKKETTRMQKSKGKITDEELKEMQDNMRLIKVGETLTTMYLKLHELFHKEYHIRTGLFRKGEDPTGCVHYRKKAKIRAEGLDGIYQTFAQYEEAGLPKETEDACRELWEDFYDTFVKSFQDKNTERNTRLDDFIMDVVEKRHQAAHPTIEITDDGRSQFKEAVQNLEKSKKIIPFTSELMQSIYDGILSLDANSTPTT